MLDAGGLEHMLFSEILMCSKSLVQAMAQLYRALHGGYMNDQQKTPLSIR